MVIWNSQGKNAIKGPACLQTDDDDDDDDEQQPSPTRKLLKKRQTAPRISPRYILLSVEKNKPSELPEGV